MIDILNCDDMNWVKFGAYFKRIALMVATLMGFFGTLWCQRSDRAIGTGGIPSLPAFRADTLEFLNVATIGTELRLLDSCLLHDQNAVCRTIESEHAGNQDYQVSYLAYKFRVRDAELLSWISFNKSAGGSGGFQIFKQDAQSPYPCAVNSCEIPSLEFLVDEPVDKIVGNIAGQAQRVLVECGDHSIGSEFIGARLQPFNSVYLSSGMTGIEVSPVLSEERKWEAAGFNDFVMNTSLDPGSIYYLIFASNSYFNLSNVQIGFCNPKDMVTVADTVSFCDQNKQGYEIVITGGIPAICRLIGEGGTMTSETVLDPNLGEAKLDCPSGQTCWQRLEIVRLKETVGTVQIEFRNHSGGALKSPVILVF